MLKDLYAGPSSYRPVEISPEYFALDNVDTVENGIVARSCVVKPMSVARQFDGFYCHDFDIASIIATGSDKLLRPVQFRNADLEGVASSMINVIKMFDSDEKAS